MEIKLLIFCEVEILFVEWRGQQAQKEIFQRFTRLVFKNNF